MGKDYIPSVDLRTKEVHIKQVFETLCGLTHVHTVFSTVLKNRILFKCTKQRNVDRVDATQSCVLMGYAQYMRVHTT